MLDAAGAICAYLRDDGVLMEMANGAIYTEEAALESEPPLVVVRPRGEDQVFPDVDTWVESSVIVDIVLESGVSTPQNPLPRAVRAAILSMRGRTVAGIVFQAVGPISSAYAADFSFTPALPRWVLTVPVTARAVPEHKGVVA